MQEFSCPRPSALHVCGLAGRRGLCSYPPASVPARTEGCEPETLFSRQDSPVAKGRGPAVEATCAGVKQEVTAGVEPGERVASGADGSGEGAGEGTLVSRLFSPSDPGCPAVNVQRPGACKGVP